MIIRADASIYIEANPAHVQKIYLDIPHWHEIYPDTIKKAVILSKDAHTIKVMVDHRVEGQVPNTITIENANTVRLDERKPKFDATFVNRFTPQGSGALFMIQASLSPRGIYRVIGPLIYPLVKKMAIRQMTKYVLNPIKHTSESTQND